MKLFRWSDNLVYRVEGRNASLSLSVSHTLTRFVLFIFFSSILLLLISFTAFLVCRGHKTISFFVSVYTLIIFFFHFSIFLSLLRYVSSCFLCDFQFDFFSVLILTFAVLLLLLLLLLLPLPLRTKSIKKFLSFFCVRFPSFSFLSFHMLLYSILLSNYRSLSLSHSLSLYVSIYLSNYPYLSFYVYPLRSHTHTQSLLSCVFSS